jgi:hypothetical protein
MKSSVQADLFSTANAYLDAYTADNREVCTESIQLHKSGLEA